MPTVNDDTFVVVYKSPPHAPVNICTPVNRCAIGDLCSSKLLTYFLCALVSQFIVPRSGRSYTIITVTGTSGYLPLPPLMVVFSNNETKYPEIAYKNMYVLPKTTEQSPGFMFKVLKLTHNNARKPTSVVCAIGLHSLNTAILCSYAFQRAVLKNGHTFLINNQQFIDHGEMNGSVVVSRPKNEPGLSDCVSDESTSTQLPFVRDILAYVAT